MSDPDLVQRLATLEVAVRRLETRETPASGAGQWTPILLGGGTAGTFTYDTANTAAEYQVDGDLCHISGRLRITAVAIAPTGNLVIAGLPLTPTAPPINTGVCGVVELATWTGLTFPAGYVSVIGLIEPAAANIALIRNGSGQGAARVQGGEVGLIAAQIDFRFAGSYRL